VYKQQRSSERPKGQQALVGDLQIAGCSADHRLEDPPDVLFEPAHPAAVARGAEGTRVEGGAVRALVAPRDPGGRVVLR
jgi:hypothetical protein